MVMIDLLSSYQERPYTQGTGVWAFMRGSGGTLAHP